MTLSAKNKAEQTTLLAKSREEQEKIVQKIVDNQNKIVGTQLLLQQIQKNYITQVLTKKDEI